MDSQTTKYFNVYVILTVKSHLVFSTARLGLEEDCLSMLALGTRMILRSGQCRVADDVWNDLSDFVDLVHDFIHVDAITVGQLLVVAVPARVHQHLVLFVLFGVKHVVALLAKPDANKPRTICFSIERVVQLARVWIHDCASSTN